MDAIAGKIALITSGSTGIGAAYVRELFQHGMRGCTITDVDECQGQKLVDEMNSKYGIGKAIFMKGDITDAVVFEEVFKFNMKTFNGLDLVVNNSGVLKDRLWEYMILLNATATVRGSLLGIKYMGRNNDGCGGTIVNTASIVGLQGLSGSPCYTGTKHFVIGFTRSMGTPFWYQMTGCRFMSICPGLNITPMITDAEAWVFQGFPGLGKHMVEQLSSMTPQSVEHLAGGLPTMLNEGQNGSIWVCEGAKPVYEAVIPDRKTFRRDEKKVARN